MLQDGIGSESGSQIFSKVPDIRGEYVNEAIFMEAWSRRYRGRMPGTITGKQIAFVEQITRAESAALFMERAEN